MVDSCDDWQGVIDSNGGMVTKNIYKVAEASKQSPIVSRKAKFIVWLGALKRLNTAARLMRWGLVDDEMCRICGNTVESIDHLFCECGFANEIRNWLGRTVSIQWRGRSFD